jgi:2-keto-3-deoxy-L-rhamnonate aldolase RhmA
MTLKKRIRNKELTLGTWITIYHRAIVEIACDSGLDWVCIDLEHSSIDFDQASTLISIANSKGTFPFVRLSSNDSIQIKRLMDAGAKGIIVPMVNSKDEALKAYKSMHYPPLGFRGVGLSTAQQYGASFQDYKKWLTEESVLIVQIEHIEAVSNLESILSLDEVDGFMVGPYDLSASMAIPGEFTNPEFLAALEKIEKFAKDSGKTSGVHVVEPDLSKMRECKEKGYKFIALSIETRVLDVFYRSVISTLR